MTAELHVAAMPFPTRQGTQAVVRAMLDSLAATGRDAHLLTYGSGEREIEAAFTLHRLPSLPGAASFRSGPSAQKLAQDVALVPAIARLVRRLRPRVVVAHHVEAALACLAARARPLVFFAHTALGPELPTYVPASFGFRAERALRSALLAKPVALLGHAVGAAGARLDVMLCNRASAAAAVSPLLARELAGASGVDIAYVPPPWPVPAPCTDDERARGRVELGVPAEAEVLVYAGNLDAYQGWEDVLHAFARIRATRADAWLVVASASSTELLVREAIQAGVANRLRVTALPSDEPGRRRLYAAADVAVVPRRAAGGLPIKLLDALARGVPTIATARATAGIELPAAALIATDDDPDAIANGVLLALRATGSARDMGARGRAYVAQAHAPARFVAALDAVVARAS